MRVVKVSTSHSHNNIDCDTFLIKKKKKLENKFSILVNRLSIHIFLTFMFPQILMTTMVTGIIK